MRVFLLLPLTTAVAVSLVARSDPVPQAISQDGDDSSPDEAVSNDVEGDTESPEQVSNDAQESETVEDAATEEDTEEVASADMDKSKEVGTTSAKGTVVDYSKVVANDGQDPSVTHLAGTEEILDCLGVVDHGECINYPHCDYYPTLDVRCQILCQGDHGFKAIVNEGGKVFCESTDFQVHRTIQEQEELENADPVNCTKGDYGDWSQCMDQDGNTCNDVGVGTRSREARIETPASGGGEDCEDLTQIEDCILDPCEDDFFKDENEDFPPEDFPPEDFPPEGDSLEDMNEPDDDPIGVDLDENMDGFQSDVQFCGNGKTEEDCFSGNHGASCMWWTCETAGLDETNCESAGCVFIFEEKDGEFVEQCESPPAETCDGLQQETCDQMTAAHCSWHDTLGCSFQTECFDLDQNPRECVQPQRPFCMDMNDAA